jgi:glycosyltransferase involved in cell wall biosynthesis
MASPVAALPRITVIVAAFNAARTLQRCIDSVARQTYLHRELVVIDGGSTDGSVDIIRASRGRIDAWLSEPDRGIYHAWNKGLALARGDWIDFLGADDYLHDPHALQAMSEHLVAAPPTQRIVYGRVIVVDADGREIDRLGMPWAVARERFMRGTYCLPTEGIMFRRDLFRERGYFDESFSIAGDYEFLLRELRTSEPRYVPEIVLVDMQYGGISSRPESTLIALREMRAAHVRHGLPAFNPHYLVALLRVRLRVVLWRILGERTARRALDWGRRLLGKHPYWTRTKG